MKRLQPISMLAARYVRQSKRSMRLCLKRSHQRLLSARWWKNGVETPGSVEGKQSNNRTSHHCLTTATNRNHKYNHENYTRFDLRTGVVAVGISTRILVELSANSFERAS